LSLNYINVGTVEDDADFRAINGYNGYDYNGYMEANTDGEYQYSRGQDDR
jgi:hypothetical protein